MWGIHWIVSTREANSLQWLGAIPVPPSPSCWSPCLPYYHSLLLSTNGVCGGGSQPANWLLSLYYHPCRHMSHVQPSFQQGCWSEDFDITIKKADILICACLPWLKQWITMLCCVVFKPLDQCDCLLPNLDCIIQVDTYWIDTLLTLCQELI